MSSISAPRLFEPYPLASALLYGTALALISKAVHEYVLKGRLPGSFWAAISTIAVASWYLIRSAGFSPSAGDVSKVLLVYALCSFMLYWLKPYLNAHKQTVAMHTSFQKMRQEYEADPVAVRKYFSKNPFPHAPAKIKILLFKQVFPEVEKLTFKTLQQGFALWEKSIWWPKADEKFQESDVFSLDDIEKVWRNIFPIWNALEPADRDDPSWEHHSGFQAAYGVWQLRPRLFSDNPEKEMEDLRNACEQIKSGGQFESMVRFLEARINENHPIAKSYDKVFYQTNNVWNWANASSYLVYANWKSNLDFFVDVIGRWNKRNDEEFKSFYVSCWRMTKAWKQQFPSNSLKADFYENHISPHIVNADRETIETIAFGIFETVEFFGGTRYVEKLAQLRSNFELNPQNQTYRWILTTLELLSMVLPDDPIAHNFELQFYDINNWGNWQTIKEYFTCILTNRPADAVGSRTRTQQLDDEKWSQILNRDIHLLSKNEPTGLPKEYIQIRDKLLNRCRIEELFDKPKSKTELRTNFRKFASKIAQDKIVRISSSLEGEAKVVYTCVLTAKQILEDSPYLPD